jgi:hypothetical protein
METQGNTVSITVEQANAIRNDCNKRIELEESLIRLENNLDFKKLVDYYVKDEASRLVGLLGEPTFNHSDKKSMYREDIKEQMLGIAMFVNSMRNIHSIAGQAKKTLEDLAQATTE